MPNTIVGIVMADGANNNTIGGATANAGNVISGNTFDGIYIQVGVQSDATAPFLNKIQGNFIGTNAAGNAAIPNQRNGITLEGAMTTLVGGFGSEIPFARNIISGNGSNGVRIRSGASQNRVSGNYIGTQADGVSPLGNIRHGISMSSSAVNNIVGGAEPNSGNIIAFNNAGITLAPDAGKGNLIDPNSIFGNVGLGIDLNDDGIITPNDLHDADAGPNNLQNYPEIVSHQFPGGNLVVNFKVDSAPTNSDYGTNGIYVEFFKADSSGEGEKFLGFGYYTVADYNGGSPLVKSVNLGNAATLGITLSDRITATATDASGNTSEFTPAFAPTAANISISGRILSANGTGIFRAQVSITGTNGETRTAISNSLGYYEFSEIAVGQTYVITALHKRYQFEPPTRVLNVTEELTNVDFTASP